jgi:hypothetical protein
LAGAVQKKPAFESTEEAAEPVKPTSKKKVQVTKPDIKIPVEFGATPASGDWKALPKAPHDKPIFVACSYPQQPEKIFFWRVLWFEGPLGAGWYICGTQWHKINDEIVLGWIDDVGHP